MNYTKRLLISVLLVVFTALFVVAAIYTPSAHAQNEACSITGLDAYVYEADVYVGYEVAKTFTLPALSSDFINQLTVCGMSHDDLIIEATDSFYVDTVLGGTTVNNASVTITAESDYESGSLRFYISTYTNPSEPEVVLYVTVNIGTTRAQISDKEAKRGTGAIQPGYLTCRVAGREDCGSVNAYVRDAIGMNVVTSYEMPVQETHVVESVDTPVTVVETAVSHPDEVFETLEMPIMWDVFELENTVFPIHLMHS